MTTITTSAPAAASFASFAFSSSPQPAAGKSTAALSDAQKQSQLLARLTGFLFLVTFAAGIPPVFAFYAPALNDPAFVLGGDFDRGVSWGALLELVVVLANVGTALTLYPVLRKRFSVLSLGYVAARLTESGFTAMGIVALLALNTLRAQANGVDDGTLMVAGQALVAFHDWTFRLGPGVVVGIGNGLMLAYMMWTSRLVPRALSILGLAGGPVLLACGVGVLFGQVEPGGSVQVAATVLEFFWELFLGIWLLVKGFNLPALQALDAREA